MAFIFFQKVREKLFLILYNSRTIISLYLNVLSIAVSLLTLLSLTYYYGFPPSGISSSVFHAATWVSLMVYLVRYLGGMLFSFHPVHYIKEKRLESILVLIFVIEGMVAFFFSDAAFKAFLSDYAPKIIYGGFLASLQLFFLAISLFDLVGKETIENKFAKSPAKFLASSFILLILTGTGLLMMPEVAVSESLGFIDALFTSTSACCVTGLIVVDTATVFTLKGQMVIIILIQLGAINIVAFATFFITFFNKRGGVKYSFFSKELLNSNNFSETKPILRRIIMYSLFMEITGSVLLYFSWGSDVAFSGERQKFFYSIFHSISAFNNAGFSLFTDNLYDLNVRVSYLVHGIIALLIIVGGIGFIALQDIAGLENIRNRRKFRWKKLMPGTRIALLTTFILIVAGGLLFYVLEWGNTLGNRSFAGSVCTSIFQSVSTRTAGFNTVDMNELGVPVLIIFMLLMFIGASPGSTGGGIKTTTFAISIKSAIAFVRGYKQISFFKRSIPQTTVQKANTIIIFSLVLVFLGTFLLSITEPNIDFLRLLFEEISAYATVGLSTGITASLSAAGKVIIIISMFIGRVGTLTLVYSLSKKAVATNYSYAEVNIIVG